MFIPGERITKALKRPSDTGQFWTGNVVTWAASLETTARKSSLEPERRHVPLRMTARYQLLAIEKWLI